MATVQTLTGAATFIRIMPDTANGVQSSSMINLRDGISLRQDAAGGFTVRTSDFGPLQAAGYVTAGASTQAAFLAGIVG